MLVLIVFQLVVLLFSAVIHEVAHGFVADHLGDPTARLAGRLTLNPLKHLEWFGSLILPLMLFLISGGSFMLGWAKPVPYNPYNLKHPERDGGLIAAAGPVSNLVIAGVFSVLYRLSGGLAQNSFAALPDLLGIVVLINLLLMVFNLVPLPPLDGSKVLFALLPKSAYPVKAFLEQSGFFLVLLFIFFGFQLIQPIIFFLFRILTGSSI
ncbi:MAG: Peptidase M50 [Candidatus Jorgensenbacteria bacterium GW2011_GWA1_48_11]|uniref:Peptidase M50 n=1 Tax=Candidatus Jorgensenbacteria bacterium GW2011_GWA1_48_11 TaxID=1618660 RepID=A0A0G1X990_9BACT|nr:MAG: Peptidase M50 [Candidatus Jorgensenbacteria bacterium GW2011_GWA1_48_11]KKW12349.1 MAG: Peptidase M50 [Candidatus Jorgensenbacteria bacterium GW2011_GWB1_49_9]